MVKALSLVTIMIVNTQMKSSMKMDACCQLDINDDFDEIQWPPTIRQGHSSNDWNSCELNLGPDLPDKANCL